MWHRALTAETCGLESVPVPPEKREALAAMILAALDGLAYQVALDPEAVDVNEVFELLFGFIRDKLQSSGPDASASQVARRGAPSAS